MTAITNQLEFEGIEQTGPSLLQKLNAQVQLANSLEVTNEPAFRAVTQLYSDAKIWENRIEFMRKEANKPDQDRINERNDKAKEVLVPIKQIQGIAKKKASEYQLLLEEQKREEEKRCLAIVDLLGLEDAPYIPPVESTIRGDGAMAYTKEVTKFRVTDLSKVPAKYLQVNEEAVQFDIKMGMMEIEGIEIYKEKVTQLRVR